MVQASAGNIEASRPSLHSDLKDDGGDLYSTEPPPLDDIEIVSYNPSKRITSMIQQSFIKKQNAFGLFTPINESMNLTYGVSYQDDHHKMSGPIYTSKHMDRKRMSKNDLS